MKELLKEHKDGYIIGAESIVGVGAMDVKAIPEDCTIIERTKAGKVF